jgi:predicted phage terminase large subunit-like protein
LEKELLIKKLKLLKEQRRRGVAGSFSEFVREMNKSYIMTWYHSTLCHYYQAFAEGRIKKMMVFAPPQHGKQISHDTKVLTTNGIKMHGEIHAGDYVFGLDGKPKIVIAESPEYIQDCRVYFTDGSYIDCHEKHEWYVFSKNERKHIKITTNEIELKIKGEIKKGRGNRYKYNIPLYSPLIGIEKEIIINPYTLGVWLGDGKSSGSTICYAQKDRITGDWIEQNTQYKGGAEWTHNQTGVKYKTVKGLSYDLRKYKILNNKRIPQVYYTAPINDRLELLAGLMDTDGYTYHKTRRCCISSSSLELSNDIALLIRTFGWRSTISKSKPFTITSGIKSSKPCYQITFSPDINIPCRIERKSNTNFKIKRRRISITKIERIEPKYGKCIQVEGGIYLVGENLIPTHNSELNSRMLPSYILGREPNKRIALVAYNHTYAAKFNLQVQRIITSDQYKSIFPQTKLNEKNIRTVSGSWLRNSDEFEIIDGNGGGLVTVGVQGALTGRTADIGIIDDVYKDAMDAYSVNIRGSVAEWYWSVFRTRLHNDSQQLITFTRWHPEDLAAEILSKEDDWVVISYPAIKEDDTNQEDPRKIGEALFPEKHSIEKLLLEKQNNPVKFEALYQQNPKYSGSMPFSADELQYFSDSEILDYNNIFAVCDVADTGNDYLCFLILKKMNNNQIYLIDLIYSQDSAEKTTPQVVNKILRYKVANIRIESNNAGRLFALRVGDRLREHLHPCDIKTVPTIKEKRARIEDAVPDIKHRIRFKKNQDPEYKNYMRDLTGYSLKGTNKTDDAADATTMAIEYLRSQNIVYTWA